MLLHIDGRWGSSQSIKARAIIHELYLQAEKDNEKLSETLSPQCRDSAIQHCIGKKIIELGNRKKEEEKFIHLLNFLDFMETIGYMEDKGHVTSEELDALCGEALLFNYYIFQPYIMHKRIKHNNPEFYENFEKLYIKLKKRTESYS